MPRKICLAFGCFWSLLLLTSSVSADRVFILSRLLAIQQPGNTHGIYRTMFPALRNWLFCSLNCRAGPAAGREPGFALPVRGLAFTSQERERLHLVSGRFLGVPVLRWRATWDMLRSRFVQGRC